MRTSLPVFTRDKVTSDTERANRYLAGEVIDPSTVELDLTDACTRACPSCPFGANPSNSRALSLPFLDPGHGHLQVLPGETAGAIESGDAVFDSTSIEVLVGFGCRTRFSDWLAR